MTNVVLLSAGQGKRLSPLTDNKPKCLVSVAGKTLLEWQLQAIAKTGIRNVTVVTGFENRSVEAAVKVMPTPISVNCVFNPFYSVADNIGSCWSVRDLIGDDTVLINGDTLFDPKILSRVLAEAKAPITVTIDRKDHYDSDDMKIRLDGAALQRIGKDLEGQIDGESIGMLRFNKGGGSLFVDEMEGLLQDPASLRLWYLSIIDRLAQKTGRVGVLSIEGISWQEVDFPHDLTAAAEAVVNFGWNDNLNALGNVPSMSTGSQEGRS